MRQSAAGIPKDHEQYPGPAIPKPIPVLRFDLCHPFTGIH